jgi:uncharacterized protein (TIGR02466 family)
VSKELEFDPLENVLPAFITPIGRFMLPDPSTMNEGLKAAILEREQNDSEGQSRSNRGGWHSRDDLLLWPQPEVSEVGKAIQSGVRHMIKLATQQEEYKGRFSMTAWANVNRSGAYNSIHTHPHSHWSGVYYVETGHYEADDFPNAGELSLLDPRGAAVNMLPHPGVKLHPGIDIKPEEGLLLVFPAWLQHGVYPFRSDTRRISISFNILLGSSVTGGSLVALA